MGWTRVDPRPWTTKLTARWRHTSGWQLGHCGHPTANYPWAIFDPEGRFRPPGQRDLRDAMGFVADELAGGGR